MTISGLAQTAQSYRELQAMIKQLEDEADVLKQQMIQEMDMRRVDKLAAGEYTIRYTIYETARLDTTALKKELPDIAERFTKTSTACRFQVA